MSTLLSPESQARVAVLRARSLEGTITMEEMREAILLVRQGRVAAQVASAQSGRKAGAKGPRKSGDELLGELGI